MRHGYRAPTVGRGRSGKVKGKKRNGGAALQGDVCVCVCVRVCVCVFTCVRLEMSLKNSGHNDEVSCNVIQFVVYAHRVRRCVRVPRIAPLHQSRSHRLAQGRNARRMRRLSERRVVKSCCCSGAAGTTQRSEPNMVNFN